MIRRNVTVTETENDKNALCKHNMAVLWSHINRRNHFKIKLNFQMKLMDGRTVIISVFQRAYTHHSEGAKFGELV